ncbi:methylmalonyl-CoA epimerase [Babesia caballi]|uniref:Methylmalonyl-CoA epimerase n=1 Tax=Babesia caballi TaxID=5871 RepID=A0AAV4LTC2_BABCB|nr:methylmalonyl-CoA epimerase [Babesia caballi]
MSRQYAALGGELEYLRSVVLRVLGSMIRMCYLFETQKFAKHVPDMKEIVRNSDLRFLIKPLLSALDFELVDDRITATQVNLWVGTLYDLCNTKPPKIHNYLTTPVTLDLLTGLLSWETDAAPMRVTVITKKDTFNSLVINEHVRGLVGSACDKVSSGAALRQVVHLALRLGLYAEAARCLKQLELWTNNTLLWFDGLYHHALAESETDVLKAVQHRVQSLDALDAYGHQCTVWMLQKASNDVLAPNLNYALPGLVAHAWCALLMLFQVAVGHLYKVVQGGEEGLRELRPLFVGLFAHFKVLRWCFRGLCSETSVILHIYEGLCLVLYALCSTPMQPAESEGPAARGLKSDVISDPNESLRRYALRVFGEEDLHLPDTFAMVDLLDPGVKRRLYCAPAILAAHRTLLGATAKPSGDSATPGIVRAMPVGMPATAAELSIESLLKEFVLFTRVRTNKDKIYTKRAQAWMLDYAGAANQSELSFTFMSRDFDSLNALLLPAKTCDVRKRKPTALLALVQRMTSLQLPTPAGVLKTFPLPFAALTALVEHEKRSGEGPAAIHIQGSIRNVSWRETVGHVFAERTPGGVGQDQAGGGRGRRQERRGVQAAVPAAAQRDRQVRARVPADAAD